jgi:predicted nucleic acid-binding protein
VLVVDANVVVPALTAQHDLSPLRDKELVAPPLMWSEARSSLHEARWRDQITDAVARLAHELLERTPIEKRRPRKLGAEAWRIADELGWAKTYDAEYLALASIMGCRVVTLDTRLRRGADRLGLVVSPREL